MMGAYLQKDKHVIARELEFVFNIFPRLKDVNNKWRHLVRGEQQMLAMARDS